MTVLFTTDGSLNLV